MTMQHQIHPHDERLAALAGRDPEVESDAELRAHVSSCDACRAAVDELSVLRSALSELPDLVPSRRLQLLPPVAEPRAAGGRGWLRRLSAPIMAAGLGLLLVGAVGTSGMLTFNAASGAGGAFAPAQFSDGHDAQERAGGALPSASQRSALPGYLSQRSPSSQPSVTVGDNGAPGTAAPPTSGNSSSKATATPGDSRVAPLAPATTQPSAPWLALLLAGVALVVTGGAMRFAIPQG
jgi:hypothetical protein